MNKIAIACTVAYALGFTLPLAQAANDTWSGATSGAWNLPGNWVGGNVPGATTGTANADVATFDSAGNGNIVIGIDASRNFKGLIFDTNSASYTFGDAGANGGNALIFNAFASTINSTVANGTTITFNAPISLNGGTSIFTNNHTGTARYVFAGNITATTTSTFVINTATTGTPTGVNLVSGVLSNGGGTLSVSFGQFSSGIGRGIVELTGANTYSGNTNIDFTGTGSVLGLGEYIASGTNNSAGTITVTHGTLTLNNASNGGLASGLLTLGGGGFMRANTAAAGTLSNTVALGNSFTVAGSNSITLNGNVTHSSAANRPLTNSIASGQKLTLNGDLFLSSASGTGLVLQIRGSGETVINGDITDFSGGKGTAASGLDFSTAAGGLRSLTLNGNNSYSGNTVLAGGVSTVFTLGDTGTQTFYIGANGVNNAITGSATAVFNGDFIFDLSGAGMVTGNSWQIVDVAGLTETFAPTFAVQGFTENGNLWTSGGFTFSEASGALTFIPEPSAFALLLGAVSFLGFRRARKR